MTETKGQVQRFAHTAMATIFEVIIAGHEIVYARQAAESVFGEINRLEALLSRFNAGSDLAQVNRLKPGESIRVALEVFECLQIASSIHAKTMGAFDITVGSLLERTSPREVSSAGWTRARRHKVPPSIGMRYLLLNPQGFSVQLRDDARESGVRLDLGGIGKGFAVDKAVEILKDWDITSALVHGGASTALASGDGPGTGEQKGWLVRAGANWSAAIGGGRILLCNEAISGSGTGLRGEHILDPRTGEAAHGHIAAWALAPSAAMADALSTAFMVMDTDEVKNCCDSIPGVSALVVNRQKRFLGSARDHVAATPGFIAHVRE